jgi:hypothetical protein
MDVYFSEYYKVAPGTVEAYGAFDVSLFSDLPLFVDPFLLFNSKKKAYRDLHESIIKYLVFLRDKAGNSVDTGLIDSWYQFKEVKQNWLGFTFLGNSGRGLGPKFARALYRALRTAFKNFGDETSTKGSHLEKLCLIQGGVGRDSISDFTTNLIKEFLLDYTQTFARKYIGPQYCATFRVAKARFNYRTESWETRPYLLPQLGTDFVLLTPIDMLTRDETWINYPDMLDKFSVLPDALPNAELRSEINNYFRSRLKRHANSKERQEAIAATIEHYPVLIDEYIRLQEDDGDRAEALSTEKVVDTRQVFIDQVRRVVTDLASRTEFYRTGWSSLDEARTRVLAFKHYVENQDGYRVINRRGRPFAQETEVQLFFGLIWFASIFDVNREANNGRGPVDFKISLGSRDKSLIEFKLASNSSLKRNLQNQVAIYEDANQTHQSLKVIVSYTASDQAKVERILKELKLTNDANIILINARSDDKPSASAA